MSERSISVLTRHLESHLVKQRKLPAEMLRSLIPQARERATAGLPDDGCTGESEVEGLIEQLEGDGRRSPTLALEALSQIDPNFFELAMARRAGRTTAVSSAASAW